LTYEYSRIIIGENLNEEEWMIKTLKVVMVIYAIIGILFGLSLIFIPVQMAKWFSSPVPTDYEKYLVASLGIANIAVAVFIILAARDPLKKISWVKFAIVWALICAAAIIYALARGYVDFSQEGIALIIHTVFAVLLLILYPWKEKPVST
jgi:hypothetical protein